MHFKCWLVVEFDHACPLALCHACPLALCHACPLALCHACPLALCHACPLALSPLVKLPVYYYLIKWHFVLIAILSYFNFYSLLLLFIDAPKDDPVWGLHQP